MAGSSGRKKKKSSHSWRKTRKPLVLNHAKSIESAVEEFDRLGRQKFLKKHGFGQAINYFLQLNGRLYDSKAICGVAYGKENPTYGPLKRWQFSGGEKTVERKLIKLGFKVVHTINKHCVYNADPRWIKFQRAKNFPKEVNFFRKDRRILRLEVGAHFYFKEKGSLLIVGRGQFVENCNLKVSTAWKRFGPRNGYASKEKFRKRVSGSSVVNCIVLTNLEWLPKPLPINRDFFPVGVQGANYYSDQDLKAVSRAFVLAGAPIDSPSDEELSAIVRPLRQGRGQGRGLTGDERKAVERRAMDVVKEYLLEKWPSVEDVSATESCDFICSFRDRKLLVEVKGTTGAGEKVIVTRNEVALARDKRSNMALAVVSKIKLSRQKTPPEATGGEISCYEFPWEPKDDDLEALAFDYRVKTGRSVGTHGELSPINWNCDHLLFGCI